MEINNFGFTNFSFDRNIINERIKSKITLTDFLGLMIALGFAFIFLWNMSHYNIGAVDIIHSYLPAGSGDYTEFRYHYWIVPIFRILAKLPFLLGYGIWMVLNIIGVFIATRIFGGNPILSLASYQLLYVLYYGQITGLLAFGLALAWWAMSNKRWYLAGTGFLIAATKPQVGLILGLMLLLLADVSWKERAKILIFPTAISFLTLIIWPNWPLTVLLTLIDNPLNTNGNISLWQWIGPWSLLLFLPAIFLPLKAKEKIFLNFSAFMLSFPYFQHTGLLILFCFPVGLLPILGYLGILRPVIGWDALKLMFVIPLTLYLILVIKLLLNRKKL